MKFNINDVFGAPISKFAFGLMVCIMCSYNVSVAVHHGSITTGAYVLAGMAFLLLVAWITWFMRMYIGGKKVSTIHPEAGAVVQGINSILFVLWICSDFFWTSSPVWVICTWTLFAISAVYYVVYYHKAIKYGCR